MDSLEPQGVLALTATAGKHVVDDICDTLDIPRCKDSSDDCVQILSCNRDNIGVSAISLHHEDQKLQAVRW
jgi:superfamily II DNA helicase RecQ